MGDVAWIQDLLGRVGNVDLYQSENQFGVAEQISLTNRVFIGGGERDVFGMLNPLNTNYVPNMIPFFVISNMWPIKIPFFVISVEIIIYSQSGRTVV